MDLNLTPEQRIVRDSARSFLARAWSPARVREMEGDARGIDAGLWTRMAELGWIGMTLPLAYGGGGQTFLELVILLEETGRALLSSQLVSSSVVAGALLEDLDGVGGRWLAELATGRRSAAVALAEPGWRSDRVESVLEARGVGGDIVLSGTKLFVPFAAAVDWLLVVARLDGALVIAVVPRDARGVRIERLSTLDGGHRHEVVLDAVRIRAEDCLGPTGVGPALLRALARGYVARLAEMVGAAERVLEMSVDYARTRVQFGRPIGSFQAVAHRCADMRADVDGLRVLVHEAAWRLSRDGPAELEVNTACAFGIEALQRVARNAHQVHGAIGFSTECDLQLFTRRMKAAELECGPPALRRELVARAMGL